MQILWYSAGIEEERVIHVLMGWKITEMLVLENENVERG